MAKKGKKENYSDLSQEELTKTIVKEKQSYYQMQFNHAVSPLGNPIELRIARRKIARLMTALSSKKNEN